MGDVPNESGSPADHRAPRWTRAWETLGLVAREAGRALVLNQHLDTAAQLSYFAFLSILPLMLLVIVLASRYLMGSPEVIHALHGVSLEIFPGFGESLVEEIQRLSEQRIWSVLSVAILFWSITPLAAALRGAFRRIFRPGHASGYLKSKARDLLGALTLVALFVLLVAGRLVYGSLTKRFHVDLTWGMDALHLAVNLALAVGGLAFFFLVFTPVRLRAEEIFGGALVSALLLFLLRPAFAWFIGFNPHYGFAFGSLKAVFLLFSWVYLSFVAILLGAEIMAAANRREILLLQPLLNGATVAHRVSGTLVERFVRRYSAGETIFEEGDTGDEMLFIRSGAVELRHGGRSLRVLKEGEYFGEMSMLINTPRTATARATEEGTALIVIARNNFDTILRDNPMIGQSILREMAQRLKDTNERIARSAPGHAAD